MLGRMRGAIVGALLIVGLLVLAVVPHRDALAPDIDHGLSAVGAPLPPSADSPLGTDQLGRDVWARVAAGAGRRSRSPRCRRCSRC